MAILERFLFDSAMRIWNKLAFMGLINLLCMKLNIGEMCV